MKKYIFIIILLFAISCALLAISYAPHAVMAQHKLETALPTIPGAPAPSSGLPEYIKYLFIFGLSLVAFLALGQMIIGGITYILAAGNVAKVETAKDTIQQALLGLGLLLVSYLLLRTINPDLVNLRNPNLTPTQFQGSATSTGGTVVFWWGEPPSCEEGTYQTNPRKCTGSQPFSGAICCTNESASVSSSHDYYLWESDCREGENKVENRICKEKTGHAKPWLGWVCCYVP